MGRQHHSPHQSRNAADGRCSDGIDVWGTRSIIGLTAVTLALLAVIVVGTRHIFRTAVVLGWLQLLGWMMLFIGAGVYVAKKFGKAHPGVAEAAKRAATSKAIDLIGRLLK